MQIYTQELHCFASLPVTCLFFLLLLLLYRQCCCCRSFSGVPRTLYLLAESGSSDVTLISAGATKSNRMISKTLDTQAENKIELEVKLPKISQSCFLE